MITRTRGDFINKPLLNRMNKRSNFFGFSVQFEKLSLIAVKGKSHFVDWWSIFIKYWVILLIFWLKILDFRRQLKEDFVHILFFDIVFFMRKEFSFSFACCWLVRLYSIIIMGLWRLLLKLDFSILQLIDYSLHMGSKWRFIHFFTYGLFNWLDCLVYKLFSL